jgi:hypothetical protein
LFVQLQPFDIVEELNKSLESWVILEHPTPFALQHTISQISTFLLEFARVSIQFPQLRRLGIDLSLFSQFHVDLVQLKVAMQSQAWSGSKDDDREEEDKKEKATTQEVYFDGTQKHETIKFPTPPMVSFVPVLVSTAK